MTVLTILKSFLLLLSNLLIYSVDSQSQDTSQGFELAPKGTKSRNLFQEVKMDSHNPNLFKKFLKFFFC